MDRYVKTNLTKIGNQNEYFNKLMGKLALDKSLTVYEASYILTCAMLFIKEYEKDVNKSSYVEIAYYIILKYSLNSGDYKPLYDFSVNFGYYPISSLILNNNLLANESIEDLIIQNNINKYKNENITETFEQHKIRENILSEEQLSQSFIAPTSYGKSSIIIDHICKHNYNRIGIIVPTKSLLNQTYKNVRKNITGYKFILHDDMYDREEKFVGILTQERALRLIENNDVYFDILYIDEAHNLFKKDKRSILLSRLIRKNKQKNPTQKILYLSPLVTDSKNLRINSEEVIKEYKIKHNLKEPEYYLCDDNNYSFKNNRFLGKYYPGSQYNNLYDYIIKNSVSKNFIYHRRPIKVEEIAVTLSNHLDKVNDIEIEKIKNILKENVHKDFKLIDTIDKGIIYLHAKLPDSIKDFLEDKFKNVKSLRYIIANGVILEGVNLPIKTLFILNTHTLKEKELTNLIGRVNRLNEIFDSETNNLSMLIPKIHFVSDKDYNSNENMKNKIDLLRSNVFDDYIENPILSAYDIDKIKISYDKEKGETKASKKEELRIKNEVIKNFERIALNETNSREEQLLYYLIKNAINNFYNIDDAFINLLLHKITEYKSTLQNLDNNYLEKLYDVFIKDFIEYIDDKEIKRLKNIEARNYYRRFIKHSNLSLKEKITHQYYYFKYIIKHQTNTYHYMGDSFGEKKLQTPDYDDPRNAYVDLKEKTPKELINLAVVKIKLEEDFVSFKLNNYFNLMIDLGLISKEEYEQIVYGTNDDTKIKYINMGLSINMINKLEKDSQIENISLDEYNNLIVNDTFKEYMSGLDEYSQFKLSKVIM